MSQLRGVRRDRQRISPNLWAGVGLIRGGCGTSLVGSPAKIVAQLAPYDALGIDLLVLSVGYPHLEEAFRTAELCFPRCRAGPSRIRCGCPSCGRSQRSPIPADRHARADSTSSSPRSIFDPPT